MVIDSASGWAWLVAAALACALGAGLLAWRHRRLSNALRTSWQAATTRLDEMAQQDVVTGLPNRPELELSLDAAVARADRDGQPLCILYLGLDNFGPINDSFGHARGDQVLAELGRRLTSVVESRGAVARIGGAEFVILMHGPLADGGRLAMRLLAETAVPFNADGHEARVSASIGIAVYPEQGPRSRVIGNAAVAMRSVKLAGGAGHAEFEPRMAIDQRDQAELARDLRLAVERKQLVLFYQPKVDAGSLQITAAEALVRWHHPSRGIISPALFIPIAERHGLIGIIGNWVLDDALRQAAVWRRNGLRMRVAINVSGHQMRQDDFVERLEAGLRAHQLPPGRFTCEITETVAMENTAVTLRAFERLAKLGVHVSIDDFGTGYSSLASLRRLPVAELKIDRAFVSDLEVDDNARSIAKAIVQMAHSLDLRVVAEGVETEAQRDVLVALGCDELQGFLFARPMSAAALELWAMNDDAPASIAFRDSLFKDTMPAMPA